MCGISGILMLRGEGSIDPQLVKKMMGAIAHRGPDGEGTYFSEGIALGHNRLSIIDVEGGAQPIGNEDGTIWVVFNGEIYNYKQLRSMLLEKGHSFRTESDTEVLVHLYEERGQEMLAELQGMFAFALWDERHKTLLLARDRVGIKPLYYALTKDALVFASEVKAILAHPLVQKEVNPAALDRFLTYFYSPGTDTLFEGISKLDPGHYLRVSNGRIELKQYWDLKFEPSRAKQTLSDSVEELTALLERTVREHMISDVPVGFLLSGGVDSTALLSFAVHETDKPVSSFTIGFAGHNFADERPYARLASNAFGTDHHEMTIGPEEFLQFLPKYVWHMEEPVCEPPAVALYYVSKLARQYVKVLISGEGGDEAFAGYPNYRNLAWLEFAKSMLPLSVRRGLARTGSLVRSAGVDGRVARYLGLMDIKLSDYYYSRASGPLTYFNRQDSQLYTEQFASQVNRDDSVGCVRKYFSKMDGETPLNKMLYVDTKSWLPDDLLIKADKITMANSLELRVPFLDHKVLEFAASLPSSYKLRGLATKYILKKAFENRVPRSILRRKKTGFPVPYELWLKRELKDVLSDLLTDRRSVERGYFSRKQIQTLLDQNSNGANHSKELFSLATLELWHRLFIDGQQVTLR